LRLGVRFFSFFDAFLVRRALNVLARLVAFPALRTYREPELPQGALEFREIHQRPPVEMGESVLSWIKSR
jgi:hypothetical protein